LDEEVDETRYDRPCIQEVFKLIERSSLSPQELAYFGAYFGVRVILLR